MSTEVYYFSGTGNSLFVARELQKLMPEVELIPIVSIFKSETIKTKAENVGFIFPCHGLTVPSIVKDFVEKLNIQSPTYIFAIATRGGSIFRGFQIIDKLLKTQDKYLNATFIIDMGLNDPKLKPFTTPSKEELEDIEIKAIHKLDKIKGIIANQKNYQEDIGGVTISRFGLINRFMEWLIPFMVHNISGKVKKYFYSDSKCTGCGTCQKVCPSQKITIVNKKPLWQRTIDCYMCYACLNFCPAEAIQIYSKIWMRSYTTERGRYPHPYATVNDMSQQKSKTDIYSDE
jgi:ferredoxin